jgi:hypothetical protein
VSYRLTSTTHFLTINVAELHRDPAIAPMLDLKNSNAGDSRSELIVSEILDELAATRARATFFVGRSTLESSADVVRRVARAGHELGAHGEYCGNDWKAFRADAIETKVRLQELCGVHVRGFRSPRNAPLNGGWRFELLVDGGFEYDSSRVGGARRVGSSPRVPLYPLAVMCPSGTLVEVPQTAGPLSSSALSLRHTPYSAMQSLLADRTRAGLSAVVSFATWEIDEAAPTVAISKLAALRHLTGRRAARERMSRLLREFRFDAIGHRLTELTQVAPAADAA